MPIKTIDEYQVEYMAEPLEGSDQWGAFVAISAPSATPMHMNVIHGRQRVAADQVFGTEAEAEGAAEQAALALLEQVRNPPPAPN
ncbi:UNVERIFIED_ORG: hypothetical protein JN05_00401 [Zoogloea ramigera]|uniref:DRBM domain-containing protein n=1 Tax=Duganella zoogloeoides TaxID=75659 RepID=A0ABZ0XSP8_9BURK|nr:hypothetical protein [Duganella zoogloeoides]WQH02601.1 hypothetical protein SR858_16115 [Duganella zoogloeoides]